MCKCKSAVGIGIVYEIRHTSGHRYIGSSKTFEARWRRHRNELRKGTHHCAHLQRAWNKYGEDAFEFSILETVTAGDLKDAEQRWMDTHMAVLYNAEKIAKTNKVRPLTNEEVRKKLSDSHKGLPSPRKGATVTEETREKLRQAQLGKPSPRKGRKLSEETKEKIRQANLGKKDSPETRAKKAAHFERVRAGHV